ncbi:MAG: hypothetical protein JSV44_10120 [Candidatus Zixiibacteriota bacterium]|nr:MAG: hypothetical protein JSV44_10120 [candidate division Zixibacteria bacterium]
MTAFWAGCDENVVTPELGKQYAIHGSIAKNLDINSIFVSAQFMRNDSDLAGADIVLGEDTLMFLIDAYYLSYDSAGALPAGGYQLSLTDADRFSDQISLVIPANLAITDIALPENRINSGGNPVQLSWSLSAGASGYIVAVIQRDSAYVTDGYSFFSANGAPQANIPLEAFRLSGQLDTGWYNVHIYAYTGFPSPNENLPTALPTGFTEKIDRVDLSGDFGVVVVSHRDSIYVTQGN